MRHLRSAFYFFSRTVELVAIEAEILGVPLKNTKKQFSSLRTPGVEVGRSEPSRLETLGRPGRQRGAHNKACMDPRDVSWGNLR
jgi:hypothetical protein